MSYAYQNYVTVWDKKNNTLIMMITYYSDITIWLLILWDHSWDYSENVMR